MDKNEAKEIRARLEQQHAGKPGVLGRIKKSVADYIEYQKRETYLRVGALPIPGKVKEKLVRKLHLSALPAEERQLYNKAVVDRYLKRGKYMQAYEAFWSTWNPVARKGAQELYRKLGGNKTPVKASAGVWAYSAIKHTIVPTALMVYAAEALTGHWEAIPYTAAGIVAFFSAAGAPIVYSKWLHSMQGKEKTK